MLHSHRLLGIAVFSMLVCTSFACLGEFAYPNTPVEVQAKRVEMQSLPQSIATGSSVRDEPSRARVLTQALPWDGDRVRPFHRAWDASAARKLSLAARARRRSFEGAPPSMPHSASFGEGTRACLDCHLSGMTVGDRVAHPMSHAPLASCTQCHVESVNRALPPSNGEIATSFAGLRPAEPSRERANGAPPGIPHSIVMRNRCIACHGQFGYPGLRTDHPERSVCVQCHLVDPGVR